MNDPMYRAIRAEVEAMYPELPPVTAQPWPRPLTPAQRRVYDHVVAHLLAHGSQPSMRETSRALGYSDAGANGVLCHLRAVARKGWIEVARNRSRALTFKFLPDGSPFRGLTFARETPDADRPPR